MLKSIFYTIIITLCHILFEIPVSAQEFTSYDKKCLSYAQEDKCIQFNATDKQRITLAVGFVKIIELDRPSQTVILGRSDIADVKVRSPIDIVIHANKTGYTNIIIEGMDGHVFREYILNVIDPDDEKEKVYQSYLSIKKPIIKAINFLYENIVMTIGTIITAIIGYIFRQKLIRISPFIKKALIGKIE